MFVCVGMESAEQKYSFFSPLIYHCLPRWPRSHMKLTEVLFQVLHSLCSSCFPMQYLHFPDCGWTSSLPTLCSSKFFKVSVAKSAEFVRRKHRSCFPAALGEAGLCFSVLPRSLLRIGMDQAHHPANSTPSGLVRIEHVVTSDYNSFL